ncbi:YdcH family protein [Flavobacterium lacus]|jgi:uncharacterized protein|uniref:DUF465 domain-containing protein n=1 Tax=Flavobacterium lacus TaxID=1353778 RepID=A0A328WPS1_9FLAO|nr:DUF465 domain-containing protein [Flavobacterium lacus]RAR47305.1 hypothetical protein B0I10_110101 [Flavobacterium lacus]
MISKHPILEEFPDYSEKIKDLYHHNEEFQVLLSSYHLLDNEIFEIEKGEIPLNDDELTHKRKDRVFLKDEIYAFLQKD